MTLEPLAPSSLIVTLEGARFIAVTGVTKRRISGSGWVGRRWLEKPKKKAAPGRGPLPSWRLGLGASGSGEWPRLGVR